MFHRLARQKKSSVVEGHMMPDHVHMMISIPPKYPVSQVVGIIKGKSANHIVRDPIMFGTMQRLHFEIAIVTVVDPSEGSQRKEVYELSKQGLAMCIGLSGNQVPGSVPEVVSPVLIDTTLFRT